MRRDFVETRFHDQSLSDLGQNDGLVNSVNDERFFVPARPVNDNPLDRCSIAQPKSDGFLALA